MIAIIILLTWFFAGLLAVFGMWVSDMRGEKFDKYYFNNDAIMVSFMLFILGYIGLIIFISYLCHKYAPFTKTLYKIANIGLKKSDKKEK